MSWFTRPKRVYENILTFRTLNTHIRTWVDRGTFAPTQDDDHKVIHAWIQEHRQIIDTQQLLETAEMLTKEFSRICAVEVQNGSKTAGVLIYPRWM
jgi:hypothetical protein